MSERTVTVRVCDRCGAERDPQDKAWTVCQMGFREAGSNRRYLYTHICADCRPSFELWLHGAFDAPESDTRADEELAAWLAEKVDGLDG